MLFLGVLPLLFLSVSAQECFKEVDAACDKKFSSTGLIELSKCSPITFSGNLQSSLQKFAVGNLYESFHLLHLATYFGSYKLNRGGFTKLYRHYSDKLWEEAIDVVKYITKRGGKMDFQQPENSELQDRNDHHLVEITEIESLALVLDHMKELAREAVKIHSDASSTSHSDPAVAHYIEEKFLEAYTERIRDLTGYITELKELLYTKDICHPNNIFLFDEYLQKIL
ncbi:ferritin 2 light chain isoform X2 [Augochlora pura]